MQKTARNKLQDLVLNASPVGVLDSGVGGLSVLSCLKQRLPSEHFLYVADSAYAPYGPRPASEILARCRYLMNFFLQQKVKAVVLACNTATASAVSALREEYSLPIIGMEPALKPAATLTHSGVVGVLATEGTIESAKFLSLKNRFAREVEVITVACNGWVESIEKGEPAAARESLLRTILLPMLETGADTLILGCTHYPLIRNEIEAVVASLTSRKIELLDTGPAVAKEVERRLTAEQLLAGDQQGWIHVYTSGDISYQQVLFNSLWPEPEPLKLESLPAQEEFVQF